MADREKSTLNLDDLSSTDYQRHPENWQENAFLPSFVYMIGDPKLRKALTRVGHELASWACRAWYDYPKPRMRSVVDETKAALLNLRQLEGYLSYNVAHEVYCSVTDVEQTRLSFLAASWAERVRDLANEVEAALAG